MAEFITCCGNTVVPAYLVLQSKGYRVWSERGLGTADVETWFAEGTLGKFGAEDPVTLLGLIAMREVRGADWRASDEQIESSLNFSLRGTSELSNAQEAV